jgi:hypothetical protein
VQDPPKFTQIWNFGLKTNHLATLIVVSFTRIFPEILKCKAHTIILAMLG